MICHPNDHAGMPTREEQLVRSVPPAGAGRLPGIPKQKVAGCQIEQYPLFVGGIAILPWAG